MRTYAAQWSMRAQPHRTRDPCSALQLPPPLSTPPCFTLPPRSEFVRQVKEAGATVVSRVFRGPTIRFFVKWRIEQQPGVLFGRFGGGDGGMGNLIQERCFWYRPKEVEVICEWCGVVTLCR